MRQSTFCLRPVHCQILASIDDWARARQAGRNIREHRESAFARVNEQFESIRRLGRQT